MLSEAIPAANGSLSADELKSAHACVIFSSAFGRKMRGEDEYVAGHTQVGFGEAGKPPEASEGGRDLGRTIWHSLYDLDERRLEVKFYLGDTNDGENRYSEYQEFRLEP